MTTSSLRMAKYVSSTDSDSELSDCDKATISSENEDKEKEERCERGLREEEGPPSYDDTLYDKPCQVINIAVLRPKPPRLRPAVDVDTSRQKVSRTIKQEGRAAEVRKKFEMEAVVFRVKVSLYLFLCYCGEPRLRVMFVQPFTFCITRR